ncbi:MULTISPECIES: class I SAM-dependent methyltransferase [unclassified Streptomyces]|uniref:Class I SAM-dependent methyltransferase n=2 Tax=Streptomyces TaxID=1883 RepID=A0ABV5VHJ7_9ACTN
MIDMTEAFDAAEREMWRGRAEAYAGSFGRLCAHTVPALLDAAGVTSGTCVLDVGTGTGTAALAALERGAEAVAVDAEPDMVVTARGRGVAAEVAVLPELRYGDGEFDAVVANFALNHVGRPRAALAELRRVLRPGGRLAVTLWSARRGAGQELLGRAVQAAGAVPPADLPRLDPAEDFTRTPEGVAALLAEAGFGGVRAEELEWDHRATPDAWWSGAAGGIATIGRVVTAQTPQTVARIRREYDRLAAGLTAEDGLLRLPHVAILAHGTA